MQIVPSLNLISRSIVECDCARQTKRIKINFYVSLRLPYHRSIFHWEDSVLCTRRSIEESRSGSGLAVSRCCEKDRKNKNWLHGHSKQSKTLWFCYWSPFLTHIDKAPKRSLINILLRSQIKWVTSLHEISSSASLLYQLQLSDLVSKSANYQLWGDLRWSSVYFLNS